MLLAADAPPLSTGQKWAAKLKRGKENEGGQKSKHFHKMSVVLLFKVTNYSSNVRLSGKETTQLVSGKVECMPSSIAVE